MSEIKETIKEKKTRILKTKIKEEEVKGFHYVITKGEQEIKSLVADIYIKASLLGLDKNVVDQLIPRPYCNHNGWSIVARGK